MNPEEVYESLDSIFHSGSEALKIAVKEDFHVRVHKPYRTTKDTTKLTMDVTSWLGVEPETTPK